MRKLKADEIECRVAQVSQKGCSLLLYKTARVDRAILDEEFGQFGWQNDFKVIDGKMYGGIGIYSNDLDEWLWRWDAGTESNTEAIKGEASDCFKRAGFKWGIGVELYTAPFIFVQLETIPKGNGKYDLKDKYIKFQVTEIGYSDKGEINKLIIYDNQDNKVFELGKHTKIQEKKKEPQKSRELKSKGIEPDTLPQEGIDEHINLDEIDLYEGLKATSDTKEAFKYFNQYKDTVSDKSAFTKAWQDHVKKLGG